jgi:hypothetical protein
VVQIFLLAVICGRPAAGGGWSGEREDRNWAIINPVISIHRCRMKFAFRTSFNLPPSFAAVSAEHFGSMLVC